MIEKKKANFGIAKGGNRWMVNIFKKHPTETEMSSLHPSGAGPRHTGGCQHPPLSYALFLVLLTDSQSQPSKGCFLKITTIHRLPPLAIPKFAFLFYHGVGSQNVLFCVFCGFVRVVLCIFSNLFQSS
jgi:hypothetical protein